VLLVTPPCPINPADTVTPPEGQLYTHVSYSPITQIKTQTYQNRTVAKNLKCITKKKMLIYTKLCFKCVQPPEFPADMIPTIGQEFRSYDEAYAFYNTYAKHTGFGIKKGQRNKTRRYLQCVREGKHRNSVADEERRRDKLSKRKGCNIDDVQGKS
jgi:hypothetical protein